MKDLFSTVYLVDTGLQTGERNMLLDRSLMQAFIDGRFSCKYGANSCLWRFYGWHPHAVTLGYNQDITHIDAGLCAKEGVDIVRRPTGGRAVFHAEEFTYSFFSGIDIPNSSLYRMVHQVIMSAIRQLGIHAEFCRSTLDEAAAKKLPVTCFTSSARYELQVNGRKLVGSAQRRTGNVLLQHGSLPLTRKHKDLCRFISYPDDETAITTRYEMERKTISLEELLGYIPPYPMMSGLMQKALALHSGPAIIMLEERDIEEFVQPAELLTCKTDETL